MGGQPRNAPIQFVTGTPDFGGYRMVGSDGGVFNFGDAQYYGSAAVPGSSGWEALASTPVGGGYWLFSRTPTAAFGDAAAQLNQTSGNTSSATIVGAARLNLGNGAPSGTGWLNAVRCPTATSCMAVDQTGSGAEAGLVEVSTDGAGSLTSIAVPGSTPRLTAVTGAIVHLHSQWVDLVTLFQPSAQCCGHPGLVHSLRVHRGGRESLREHRQRWHLRRQKLHPPVIDRERRTDLVCRHQDPWDCRVRRPRPQPVAALSRTLPPVHQRRGVMVEAHRTGRASISAGRLPPGARASPAKTSAARCVIVGHSYDGRATGPAAVVTANGGASWTASTTQ